MFKIIIIIVIICFSKSQTSLMNLKLISLEQSRSWSKRLHNNMRLLAFFLNKMNLHRLSLNFSSTASQSWIPTQNSNAIAYNLQWFQCNFRGQEDGILVFQLRLIRRILCNSVWILRWYPALWCSWREIKR